MLCDGEWIYLFTDILAILSNDTPTVPYLKDGIMVHKISPWIQVPWKNWLAEKGSTRKQNSKSDKHKLKKKVKILNHQNIENYTFPTALKRP